MQSGKIELKTQHLSASQIHFFIIQIMSVNVSLQMKHSMTS